MPRCDVSAICGAVNFDGAPVDPAVLRRMTAAAPYRGPDGIRHWVDDNVALAHLAFHVTPESVLERQPLASPTAGSGWWPMRESTIGRS